MVKFWYMGTANQFYPGELLVPLISVNSDEIREVETPGTSQLFFFSVKAFHYLFAMLEAKCDAPRNADIKHVYNLTKPDSAWPQNYYRYSSDEEVYTEPPLYDLSPKERRYDIGLTGLE